MTYTRAIAIAAVLGACAVTQPGHVPPQWEQTAYTARPTAWTASGIGLDGALDAGAVDALADAVDECLAAADVDAVADEARCWPESPWQLDRAQLTVVAVPGERACTVDAWVLPDSAGDSCEQWGKPDSECPCRWAVATQDAGRTVVVPQQQPYERMGEGFARVASACLYPWSDEQVARCSQVRL